jgi:hypothetical protein
MNKILIRKIQQRLIQPYYMTCKRCGGQLRLEWDVHGLYKICYQCGAVHDITGQLEIRDPIAEGINLQDFARHYPTRRGTHPNSQHNLKYGRNREFNKSRKE